MATTLTTWHPCRQPVKGRTCPRISNTRVRNPSLFRIKHLLTTISWNNMSWSNSNNSIILNTNRTNISHRTLFTMANHSYSTQPKPTIAVANPPASKEKLRKKVPLSARVKHRTFSYVSALVGQKTFFLSLFSPTTFPASYFEPQNGRSDWYTPQRIAGHGSPGTGIARTCR